MKTLLLNMNDISLHIAGVEMPILTNIDFQVKEGDFVIVLGSNGSGKSSLLKLIDRRMQLSKGKLELDGMPLTNYSVKNFSRKVKTLTQNCHESLFTSLTVFENFRLMSNRPYQQTDRDFFANYLQQFNSNLPNKLEQIVNELSGGEKQALALALIMLNPPRLLLLDEHTSALDPKSAEKLIALTAKMVKLHNVTCLLTTHDLSIAEQFGNRIMALKHGKLTHMIEYNDKQLMNRQHLLTACY